ncbi:deoxyribodipyrimidine photo-lyase [Methanogenium organophilum]|uniref:Deoxyribodipyrimidine photo-lyase n=1 Tax=Methanogenium organophilum TaxID=2199 RepID=A0A9X9S5C2_METOG|nr:deoxyribodipyrimidine photo-lyase [Methanogenium organophilum]WAI01755.1 deoxyribodipyrimidine photo-lyase [Methanogenium organophilum]
MERHLTHHDIGRGDYVLYWMQASQRAERNAALDAAIREANQLHKPVLVCFCLDPRGEGRQIRHLRFMLEGLTETQHLLEEQGITFMLRSGPPHEVVPVLAEDACLVVTDRGYLRGQREDRSRLAERLDIPFIEVEGDVIVPVEVASHKEEWSAATFRRRITPHLDHFPMQSPTPAVTVRGAPTEYETLPLDRPEDLIRSLNPLEDAGPAAFAGGLSEARRLLEWFMTGKLSRYATGRNDPNADVLSCMSPYLHFGQISPLEVALRVRGHRGNGENAAAYLEELIVRRELSMNFVHYDPDYATPACLPDWAKKTLAEHARDPREYVYTLRELEEALTHDPYWNAAQTEMRMTGKMHGYMRMYWGKKVIEWSQTPEEAYNTLLTLNNRYELDGRDPNSYAGIAWCFGKHDRAWKERPVFGKVRYMNAKGLRRKFDAGRYAARFGDTYKKG